MSGERYYRATCLVTEVRQVMLPNKHSSLPGAAKECVTPRIPFHRRYNTVTTHAQDRLKRNDWNPKLKSWIYRRRDSQITHLDDKGAGRANGETAQSLMSH